MLRTLSLFLGHSQDSYLGLASGFLRSSGDENPTQLFSIVYSAPVPDLRDSTTILSTLHELSTFRSFARSGKNIRIGNVRGPWNAPLRCIN